MSTKLLTFLNAKTVKGEAKGYLTGILYLLPSDASGVINVCTSASEGCRAACLNTAGRGRFDNIQAARLKKTLLYANDRKGFEAQLEKDIQTAKRKAARMGLKLAIRVNGTSDLPALARTFAKKHPDVMFYDYTKHPKPWTRELPNYRITFSRSESNTRECIAALENGVNVAVVFDTPRSKPLPETWKGYKVVDGDMHDLRFLDPKGDVGVIVGLHAKGKAHKDTSGFVVKGETC